MDPESLVRPYRLGYTNEAGDWVEYRYPDKWQRQSVSSGPDRIIVGPRGSHVGLMMKLAEVMTPPFRVLYVLLVPRSDEQDEGRFELVQEFSLEEAIAFLERYRTLFENDGRHHVWLSTETENVVYDQHNVLYLYGPLEKFEAVLSEFGLSEGEVSFPSPHSHHYHKEMDGLLDDMLERYRWQWYPLDTRTDKY